METRIAVCGPRKDVVDDDLDNAHDVGTLLAQAGVTVLCGGGAGVMAKVAQGVSDAGGTVIGIRPDADADTACEHLTHVLPTGMGEARNNIIVLAADAVIVIGGSWGTMAELCLANRNNKPVVQLGGWTILDRNGQPVEAGYRATTAAEATAEALRLARNRPGAATT